MKIKQMKNKTLRTISFFCWGFAAIGIINLLRAGGVGVGLEYKIASYFIVILIVIALSLQYFVNKKENEKEKNNRR